jgi:hypothetical protein
MVEESGAIPMRFRKWHKYQVLKTTVVSFGNMIVFFGFSFLAGSWTPLQVFNEVARSLEFLFFYAEEVHTLVTYGLFHGECIKGARVHGSSMPPKVIF